MPRKRGSNPTPKPKTERADERAVEAVSDDPTDQMLGAIRYADEVDESEPEPAVESPTEVQRERERRIADATREYQRINNEASTIEAVDRVRAPVKAPVLPPLPPEVELRLRPKIYTVMRHPTREGCYHIPAGVLRVRTPGVSRIELHPGQVITDRDYDIDRLRVECGVVVEDYKPSSAA